MKSWVLSLPIRWKLQLSFLLVTLFTIIIIRWDAYYEISLMIDISHQQGATSELVNQLRQAQQDFLIRSIWVSAVVLLVLLMIISIASRLLVTPIMKLCKALDGVEHGDLTVHVDIDTNDEIGILEKQFNAMVSHLNEIMQSLDSSSKQMTNSAFQVSAISHEISDAEASEQQRRTAVIEATDDLQQSMSRVHEIAEHIGQGATQMEGVARDSKHYVIENISTMEHMTQDVDRAVAQIQELNESASTIVSMVDSIRDIAEQTNLLALNAAIEAARAGEQGRGFAVVADEVRSLASRTTLSTGEIASIIEQLTANVNQVTDTMNQVVDSVRNTQANASQIGQSMDNMANEISQTANSNKDIAEVSQQQINNLDTLKSSLQNLFDMNKQNHSKVETTASIADDIYHIAGKLQTILSEFSFTHSEPAHHMFAGMEKRNSPRADCRLRVVINQLEKELGGSCLDFSMTGIKLKLGESIDPALPIGLEIYIPYDEYKDYQSQEPVHLSGQVMWDRIEGGYYLYGIQFTNTDAKAESGLKQCFEYFCSNCDRENTGYSM